MGGRGSFGTNNLVRLELEREPILRVQVSENTAATTRPFTLLAAGDGFSESHNFTKDARGRKRTFGTREAAETFARQANAGKARVMFDYVRR